MQSKLFAALLLTCAMQVSGPQISFGQSTEPSNIPIGSIAIVDQIELFDRSLFGQKASADFQRLSTELSEENDQIAKSFEEEERQLAADRSALSKEEFQSRAEDFDARVKASRTAQDQKLRELNQFVLEQRARFFDAARPVLLQIMQENGIDAILARDAILLFRDNIDITDQVIAILDERLPIE